MVTLSIRVPEVLLDQLRVLALREYETASSLTRILIREYVREQTRNRSAA